MKTSFEKFMASSAVQSVEPAKVEMSEVKVALASVDDINKLAAEIAKIGNQGMASAKKAVEIAKTTNPHLADARKVYQGMSSFKKKNYELYKEIQQSFKNLGIDMPNDVKAKFDSIEDAIGLYEGSITTNMLEAKNIIDNRY